MEGVDHSNPARSLLCVFLLSYLEIKARCLQPGGSFSHSSIQKSYRIYIKLKNGTVKAWDSVECPIRLLQWLLCSLVLLIKSMTDNNVSNFLQLLSLRKISVDLQKLGEEKHDAFYLVDLFVMQLLNPYLRLKLQALLTIF